MPKREAGPERMSSKGCAFFLPISAALHILREDWGVPPAQPKSRKRTENENGVGIAKPFRRVVAAKIDMFDQR
jgi:hypothetical protein